MSTDDAGSWAQPNPTDRTDPDFVDITRLAPAAEGNADTHQLVSSTGKDGIESAGLDLVALDVDDVSANDVAEKDIAEIMAGFQQRTATGGVDSSLDNAAVDDAANNDGAASGSTDNTATAPAAATAPGCWRPALSSRYCLPRATRAAPHAAACTRSCANFPPAAVRSFLAACGSSLAPC